MRSLAVSLLLYCLLSSSAIAAPGTHCPSNHLHRYCVGLDYTNASYPNAFGHKSYHEASIALEENWYITELQCSEYAKRFLCMAFFPPCHPASHHPHNPCKETCLLVMSECRTVVMNRGAQWPSLLSCDRFESQDSNLCFAAETDQMLVSRSAEMTRLHHTSQCSLRNPSLCTGNLIHNSQFSSVSFGGIQNCTQPCNGVYFTEEQLTFLRYWTIAWSAVCLSSCVTALLIYVICYRRIRHPEAPIFYIALCYVGICFAYLLSNLVDNRDLFCDTLINNTRNKPALLADSLDMPLCATVFSIHYYSTLATWSWLLVLTVEWLVTVVRKRFISWKWQIGSHILGWGLPIPFLIASLAVRAAAGNSLLQICWISSQHHGGRYQLVFIILPLMATALGCFLLLLTGFCFSLCSTKQTGHRARAQDQSDKVPLTLLCRTSIFSVVFLVINCLVLCCYLYEFFMHQEWERFYLQALLHFRDSRCSEPEVTIASRPSFVVVLITLASSIVAGAVLLLWVLRPELLCCCRKSTAVLELSNNGDMVEPKQSSDISLTNYSCGSALTQWNLYKLLIINIKFIISHFGYHLASNSRHFHKFYWFGIATSSSVANSHQCRKIFTH